MLGGYTQRPAKPAYEALFNQDFHREAFDPGLSLDAYVGAYVAILDGLDLELYRGYLRHATDPVASAILKRLTQDKERHVAFGWVYLTERAARWSEAERADIVAEIDQVMRALELGGYHCAWLVRDGAADDVVAADRITRAAGLGALKPEEERAIFAQFFEDARAHLGRLGLPVADVSGLIRLPR